MTGKLQLTISTLICVTELEDINADHQYQTTRTCGIYIYMMKCTTLKYLLYIIVDKNSRFYSFIHLNIGKYYSDGFLYKFFSFLIVLNHIRY